MKRITDLMLADDSFPESLQKELPLICSLKFQKAFSRTEFPRKQKNWLLDEYKGVKGIYFASPDGKNVSMGISYKSLAGAVLHYFRHNENAQDVVALLSTGNESPQKVYREIRKELAKIPIDDTYEKISPFLSSDTVFSVDQFDFVSPYKIKNGRRAYTLSHWDYEQKGGCYIILDENGEVAYIGQSTTSLLKVMHHHFCGYTPDREGKHYRVSFADKLNVNDYRVCLVEVPALGKNGILYRQEITALEEKLIKDLKPLYNIKGMELTGEGIAPPEETVEAPF